MDVLQAVTMNLAFVLSGIVVAVFAYLKFVKTGPVYKGDNDLTGKTVLITGGNVGIGKETAIGLAKRKARVIIACRNIEKASKAVEDIKLSSGSEIVYYMKLDLSDLDSVRDFAKEFTKTEPRLHILVNNAAIVQSGKTKQGFDMMFGTNHLGPFLLTNLLMPLLKKTSESSPVRIVNLCSAAYRLGKVDLENLNPDLPENASSVQTFVQYSNTKLMNVYFTAELNRKLRADDPESQKITTYSVHPGAIQSRLGGDLAEGRGWLSVMFRNLFLAVCARSCFYGCQTTLYCCLQKGLESESGKYFSNLKVEKLLPLATDEKLGAQLWQRCEDSCGLN